MKNKKKGNKRQPATINIFVLAVSHFEGFETLMAFDILSYVQSRLHITPYLSTLLKSLPKSLKYAH